MYPKRPLGNQVRFLSEHIRVARRIIGLDILVIMALVSLARFMPHPPNMAASVPFAILCAQRYPRWLGCVAVICLAFVTDALLAWCYGYPVVGSWTLFTYTAFVGIVLVARHAPSSWWRQSLLVGGASLGYWFWTNWGVWLSGHLYPHTWSGLLAAYTSALPFLLYAMIGDLGWYWVLRKLWQQLPWYVPSYMHHRGIRWSPHRRHS